MKSDIILELNKRFYDEKTINEALDDFKEVCSGKIANGKFQIILQPKEDIENLDLEFANYILGLMKNKTIV